MFPKEISLEKINQIRQSTMVGNLGIEFTEIGTDYLTGTMPVDERTRQPFGVLHGGASVALAETLGSMAATLLLDTEKWIAVGQEINANHIRPVTSGIVTGKATPVHIGKSSHVWEIRIVNEEGKLVCISRLTMAIIERRK